MTAQPDQKCFDAAKAALLAVTALQEFRPPQNLTASEWAELHHVENGSKVRLIPYQREILDAFSDPQIEECVFMKSARVGATMLMTAGINYQIAEQGGYMAITLPTEADGRDFASDVLATSLSSCQPVKTKLDFASTDNLLLKTFPGGSLRYMFAASPRTLRRHNLDTVCADEVAAFNDAIKKGGEGDPLSLALRRLQNSSRAFAYIASTPVEAETDIITARFLATDQRHFHVPAPCCGAMQDLKFKQLRADGYAVKALVPSEWPASRLEATDIRYQCEHCGEQFDEQHKKGMLEAGEWIAHAPENAGNGKAGFFINTLYSPFPRASWARLVAEWLEAKKSPETQQTFVNTVEGLPWSMSLDELDIRTVKARTRSCSMDLVPPDILQLAVGVDLQADRWEASILGFQAPEDGGGIVLLDHIVTPLDPTIDPSFGEGWDALDKLLKQTWQHELGGQIGLSIAAVDSSAFTDQAYAFCAPRNNVHPIKGRATESAMWRRTRSKQRAGAAGLQIIGSNAAKTFVFQRLVTPTTEPGALMLAESIARDEIVEQLLGEKRVFKRVGGRAVAVFEPIPGVRNEVLDCVAYACAAAHSLRPNWKELRNSLTVQHGAPAATQKKQSPLDRIAAAAAVLNG